MVYHVLSCSIMVKHGLSFFSWLILVFGGLSHSETHLAVVETPRVKDNFCLMICPSLKLLGKSPETHGATCDFSLRFSLIFDKIYILYQHVPTCANSCWKGNAPGQERDRVFSRSNDRRSCAVAGVSRKTFLPRSTA